VPAATKPAPRSASTVTLVPAASAAAPASGNGRFGRRRLRGGGEQQLVGANVAADERVDRAVVRGVAGAVNVRSNVARG
jgi:hypothetical protein